MKFCVECGTKNEDRAKFCYACGAAMSVEDPIETPIREPVEEEATVPFTPKPIPVAAVSLPENLERNYRAAFNIPKSETIITTIGNSFVQNLLMSGIVNKAIAVATNRRFYYQSRILVGEGRSRLKFSREIESGSVLVKDISYTGMRYRDLLWVKVLAILCTAYTALVALPMCGA